ncbi:MAG TPA: lasso RiPP family leader peptide-containing protein [Chondromyces sp.]|nr:lasso RiPP family leader peptide-containing protein [Chondromyces sp.]
MDDNRSPTAPAGPVRTSGRRPYGAPRLVVYGEVRELTAGGTGNASENAPGPDPSKRRP